MFSGIRNISSIGVFCGSSAGFDAKYAKAAAGLGSLLADHKIRLVYGGGNVGLMGIMADAVLARGGEVMGVITEQLAKVELAHKGVQEMLVVSDMSERKNAIVLNSDAFIAMPGGLGTYDELFEVLTLCQLHIISKPVGLLNVDHFFDPLIQMVGHSIQEGFMRDEHSLLFVEDPDPEQLIRKLFVHDPPETRKWLENFNKEKY
jgi:uncharacterized protein (TIGR00730 family)